MKTEATFTQIENHFGYGPNNDTSYGRMPEAGWRPLTETNLVILVGVTGVGKSRTMAELSAVGLAFGLLPNRRVLTDHLIIGALQREDGKAEAGEEPPIIRERKERFAYTRRYRERYQGGMAHALGKLWISEEIASGLLFFDGLRGVNEVDFAARHLPRARFVALCAPDGVRIERLLGRNDAFDHIDHASPSQSAAAIESRSFAERFPAAANLRIAPDEEEKLRSLLDQQLVTEEEVAAKLAIVGEERRNYDPDATLATLQSIAPDRLCIVDTVEQAPNACAKQIVAWLR